jgi:hypothetical protein
VDLCIVFVCKYIYIYTMCVNMIPRPFVTLYCVKSITFNQYFECKRIGIGQPPSHVTWTVIVSEENYSLLYKTLHTASNTPTNSVVGAQYLRPKITVPNSVICRSGIHSILYVCLAAESFKLALLKRNDLQV